MSQNLLQMLSLMFERLFDASLCRFTNIGYVRMMSYNQHQFIPQSYYNDIIMFSVFIQHYLNDLLSKLNTKIHNWKLWKFTRTWKKPFDPWVHKVMCWAVKSFVVSRSARDNPGGRWAVPRWGCSPVLRMGATPLLKVIGMFRTMLLIMFDLCSCCNMYCVLLFFLNVLFLFVSYSCSFCYYTACCCWCCCRQCCGLCILCLQSKTRAMFVYIAGLRFHLPHSLDAICTPFTLYEYWFTPKSNQHQIYFKTVIWYEPMILNLNDWHLHCSDSSCSSFSSRWKGGADALESQWEGQGLEYGPSLDLFFAETQGCFKSRVTSFNIHLFIYVYIIYV